MLKRLKQTRQRYRLQLFLSTLARSLAVLASLLACLLLGARFGLPDLLGTRPAALMLAALAPAAVLFSLWFAWRNTPGLPAIARQADLHFGLEERLSTSLEAALLQDETPGPLARALRAALHSDAESAAAQVIPARLVPLKLPAGPGFWLAGSLLALTLLQLRQADDWLLLPRFTAADSETHAQQAQAGPQAQPLAGLPDTGTARADQEASDAAHPPAHERQSAAGPASANEAAAAGDVPVPEPGAGATSERTAGPTTQDTAAAGAGPPGPAAPETVPARNDGATNPAYGPAPARDQELREQARRQQERAGNPGGGGGDQAALADSSVAGDATAGFEGNQDGVLPETAGAGAELSLPDAASAAGDRIRVELPPETSLSGVTETPLGTFSWNTSDEAAVIRNSGEIRAADRALLQRYHSLAREQAEARAGAGQPDTAP